VQTAELHVQRVSWARDATTRSHSTLTAALLLTRIRSPAAWTDRQIVEALETSLNNVSRARKRLVEQGFEAVLTRHYNRACARPKIFDGDGEAKLIAVACSKPPDGRALGRCVCWRRRSSNLESSRGPATTPSGGF